MGDAEEAAGSRPAQVCQACRIRHKKCDFDNAACRQCQSIGLECVRQPSYRFRYDPKQRALAAESPAAQSRWAQPLSAVEFYNENPGLLQMYTGETAGIGDRTAGCTTSFGLFLAPSYAISNAACEDSALAAFYHSPPSDQTSPGSAAQHPEAQHKAIQPFTESEAVLVRNFVDNMALWTDVTDPTRSFQLEVPRRALTEPILKHAICAFSARHFHRERKDEEGQTEALDHLNRCLELLIPAMSGGQGINESILTAVAVLRQNEEMDEQDHRFHLEGVSRILNTVPGFAAAGGLGEAAAWLCLREDIYISLTTQSPIKIGVESFLDSVSIRRNDDFAWANKMVLGLAVLLNRAFSESASQEGLAASEAEIETWGRSKPVSFEPTLSRPSASREGRYFPELWMLAPHHAVGLQYFHIAQIVLIVLRKRVSTRPYEHLVEDRARERQIRHHLKIIVGLAVSNERAENIWFTARHCLSVWAGCLRKRGDQQAALQFLRDMEQRTGWRTAAPANSMRLQWDEDSDDE